MYFRPAWAALAALPLVAASALADAPLGAPTPTPIKTFEDAAGKWTGEVDLGGPVMMLVAPDGMVTFTGPHNLKQQGRIKNDRLVLGDAGTDLDCGIMNDTLVCHARFSDMYAELNLRKRP